jgi:hypothetical protein
MDTPANSDCACDPAHRARHDRTRYFVAAAGALLVLSLTQYPLVSGARSPVNDALQFFGPYHLLTGQAARHGSLVLWNPLSNGGAPDYIEPQVGAVSPAVLVTGLVAGGAEWGFRLYWLLVWFGGGAGVIALGRQLGAPPWGCFCAASGFMLSGFYIGHAQHTAMLASASYLPWIVWRLDVALLNRRPLAAAQGGVLLGLSGLGGYPGVLVMNGMAAGLWLLGRFVTRSDRATRSLSSLLWTMAIAGATAAAVLSPTYAAFAVEGRGFTWRTGPLPRPLAVENNSLLPWNAATLVSPAALFWQIVPDQDASMRSVYIGVVVVALAIWALRRSEGGWRPWLACCALFFLAAALGSTLPVRGWLYDYFPPTRYFRHASLFREPAMLLVTVLALLGSRDIAEHGSPRESRRLAVLTAALAAIMWLMYSSIGSRSAMPTEFAWPATLALWGAVPLVFLMAGVRGLRVRAGRLLAAGLMAIAVGDAANAAWQSAPQVYGTQIASWKRIDRLRRTPPSRARLIDREDTDRSNFNLAFGTAVLESYAPLASPLHHAFVADPTLNQMALGPNRFWFVAAAPAVPLTDRLMADLSAATRLAAPAVVVHAPRAMLAGVQPAAGDRPEPATGRRIDPVFRVYDPTHLELEVHAPEAGWLIVTDRWARGWEATVNGTPAAVWGANGIWRAVRVRAGRNVVAMRYRPFGYPWLVLLSWGVAGTVSTLTILSPAGRVRRRAARPPANTTRSPS